MQIKIRPLVLEDAYTSYIWRNDKEVFKYTGTIYTNEITLEMELEWIKKVIKNNTEYRCAILADDVYVGNIYLTNIDKTSATYHIFIGKKNYYGKGVAYKASLCIIKYAISNLALNTLNLTVRKENTPAVHLYNKLGFKCASEDADSFFMYKQLTEDDE